ncbi:MAG: phosphoribosylglycinamide formyltransferase [Solirubrobacterales bacterium]|nr:phosphoribosylglycinamide formyltransferase [Solirubrobacterales bacterium]
MDAADAADRPLRIGVLASGEGTNLQALLDGVHGREALVVAVGSDRAAAPALERAAAAGVVTRVFPRASYEDRAARDAAMSAWLTSSGVELVVLAGYMALLSPAFTGAWAGRLVNVHPSLLPAFPGIHAIRQALDYGVKVFGVTVHLVDDGVDTGPILAQAAVELPAARAEVEVHAVLRPLEHALLCDVVRRYARGTVRPDAAHPRRMLLDEPGPPPPAAGPGETRS